MVLPWHIYQEAEADGIEVHFQHFCTQPSMSVPGHIGIDTDKLQTTAEEATAAAHELAHCDTGSFYNVYSPIDSRRKNENRADRYAILRYIPEEELLSAVRSGLQELWQLADYFGFTEDFIKKAICLYRHGNLAVDMYL